MEIKRLIDQPDKMKDVANIIYDEFAVKKENPKSLEDVLKILNDQEENSLPITLVAVENGHTMGTVTLFQNDLKVREKYTPWLGSLAVVPEYRNQGVGKLLLDEMKQLAKSLNYNVLYLRTEETADYYRKNKWTYVETVADDDFDHIDVFKMNL